MERKVGSCKYNCNQCQVCQSISETDTFTFSNDGNTYKINHKFDCNEKCLIYLTACKKCFKQYVGQTVDAFKSLWNNHKDNARNYERGQHCIQKHLYELFDLSGHTNFIQDVRVTLLKKNDRRNPTEIEDYWIYTLQTKAPIGLDMAGAFLD